MTIRGEENVQINLNYENCLEEKKEQSNKIFIVLYKTSIMWYREIVLQNYGVV